MKYRYRTDDEMKDSGVEWLGKIPKEWDLGRVKYFVREFVTGGTPDSHNENYYTEFEFGIPWISIADMSTNDFIKNTNKSITEEGLNSKRLKILPKGTLIYSIFATLGKVSELKIEATTNQAIMGLILKDNKIDKNYLKLFLKFFENNIKYLSSSNTQENLNKTKVANINLFNLNKKEQKKIASFLDKKTAEFDNIIEKKQSLITKLTEAKKSLISEVVTGKKEVIFDNGHLTIRDRTDDEMKDSGVEWLGKIPKEWEISKVKYSTYVKGRIGWQGLKSDEFIDEGPFLVTGTDFKDNKINWDTCYHVSEERYNEAKYIQLQNNDLLITKDGTIGKTAIVENCPKQAVLNSGIFLTRCINNEYITKFMFHILNSKVFETYIDITKTGSTIQHLYQETFVNFSYSLPTLQEQQLIVDFLDKKTAKIDSTIERIKLQIEKLKEAKQSLISEAVTGKIEVLD